MLEQVVSSPLVPQVAKLIQSRLGRPLEPFDIWYSGFRPGSKYTEAQLDEIVAKKYPNAEAYRADIPNLLKKLGFPPDRAQYIADHIIVDPARGSGHAMRALYAGLHRHRPPNENPLRGEPSSARSSPSPHLHRFSKSTGPLTSCTRKYFPRAGYFLATASYMA